MNEKKAIGEKRSSNWNFILYPESAPENWCEVINETRIEWIMSPLHDKDINSDGEIKKSHYHITLLYPSLKSFDQVQELTDSVNAPIPIRCQSVKGSIRYMVHKDNPEKYQYNWSDIKCHGGADLSALCAPTATERLQVQQDIINYIRSAGIVEFEDIVNYSIDNGLTDWTNLLLNYSTMSISTYVRSRRYKLEKSMQNMEVDPKTGEVK